MERLSNPARRRLTDAQTRQMVDQYRDGGDSIGSLSRRFLRRFPFHEGGLRPELGTYRNNRYTDKRPRASQRVSNGSAIHVL